MRAFRLDWMTAAGIGFLGTVASAEAAFAQTATRPEITKAANERSDGPVARRDEPNPARIVADQISRERRGGITGLLSKSFKAAYDAVPRDEDNLGVTILGGSGYDVPDKVVKVSKSSDADATDPWKASATVTLHYTNPDAPVPSFDRDISVVFAKEGGRWTIDDVYNLDPQGRRTGRGIGLKRALESLRRTMGNGSQTTRKPGDEMHEELGTILRDKGSRSIRPVR